MVLCITSFALRGTFRSFSNLYIVPTFWLYLAIRLLISSSIVPFVLTLHPRYLKCSTCLNSMSCTVILTSEWWCSVDDHYFSFHEIEFESVLCKSCIPGGHTLFKFFLRGCSLCNVIRMNASINCLSLSFSPWTSFITRSMYNKKIRGDSILPCRTPDLLSNHFSPPIWVLTLLMHTLYVTRRLKMRRFSKNSALRYGLKCKLIGSLVKLGFRQKTIHKHLIFHITNLQLRECIAKGVYLVVL